MVTHDNVLKPGQWVLIDLAGSMRDSFEPTAYGIVVSKVKIKAPWYNVVYVYPQDNTYGDESLPLDALRPFKPTQKDIDLWISIIPKND